MASERGGERTPATALREQRVGQISVVPSEREERREREGSGWLPGVASRERSAFEFRLLRSCDGDPYCSRDAKLHTTRKCAG